MFVLIVYLTFCAHPSKAAGFTIDPVGLTSIIFENPFNCTLNYYQYDDLDQVYRFSTIPGIADGPYKLMVQIQSPLLPRPTLRGEQVNFGYEPIISEGRTCPDPGIVTMKNRIATVEKLEFDTFVFNGLRFEPNKHIYQRITFPSGVIIHLYTQPYDPQPEYIDRDIFYPVIFIHGLGGRPEEWKTGDKKMYWEKFLAEGYPEDLMASYAYADSDGNPSTYDYQGDITKLDDDLPALVDSLATKYEQKYGTSCNNSCVDVVAYSLGGVITREYLNEHPISNKIRKVVTIASPHQGSQVLNLLEWASSIPFGGQFIENALVDGINAFMVGQAEREHNDHILNISSPAALQMRPHSTFLDEVNSYLYDQQDFHLLYGEIDATISQKLFHFELNTPNISLGDVIVSKNSATTVNASKVVSNEFSDSANLVKGNILLAKNDLTYKYKIDFLGMDDSKYFHLRVPLQEDVLKEAINAIRN